MSLRLVFTIIACSIALAHNVDGLQEQNAESPFGEDPISLSPQSAIYPDQHKSVHRRQSPEAIADDAVCETDDLTPVKVADISHDTGSLHANKRSLDVQSDNVAEPGCCGNLKRDTPGPIEILEAVTLPEVQPCYAEPTVISTIEFLEEDSKSSDLLKEPGITPTDSSISR